MLIPMRAHSILPPEPPWHLPHGRWRWALFGALLATIPAFYLELAAADPRLRLVGWLLYLATFVVFSSFLTVRGRHARNRAGFIKRHWLDALIAVGAAGSLLGSYGAWSALEWVLRLGFVVLIVARILLSLRRLIPPAGMIYMLALGVAMLALAGAGFYWLEPTVTTYADGVWLAFVSGATVGYGDLVPTTPASRVFAAFMVLLGYAVMSLVTASIAAIFVGEDEKALLRDIHRDIRHLREEVALLRATLTAREAADHEWKRAPGDGG